MVQYYELLKLEEVDLEEDGVDEIIVYNEQADEEIDTGHPKDLGYNSAEEEPLSKEKLSSWLCCRRSVGSVSQSRFHLL